jgi:tRNA A-37 threonylcarbamoyl transferase component Bud32
VDWQRRAELLECAGYLIIAGAAAPDDIGELSAYFEIGALAARMHAYNVLHGDMHRANFGFESEPRPVGERAITYDPGDISILQRPPTARERAQDLAILKATCSFIEWEAAKFGYRFKAPEIAPEVFSLI